MLKLQRAHYVTVLRSMELQPPFFNKFINLRSDQRRLVCSWYCTSNHLYLLIFIDGLQLRHSFSAPKRLDVKMPLQSIEPCRKSMINIPLVGVFKKFECTVKTFVDSLWLN